MRKMVLMSCAALCVSPLFAKIELGSPFADGAVLQRGMEVPVWGAAAAGHEITVSFAGAEVSAVVGADGKWLVKLPEMAASKESRTLKVVEREAGWIFGSTVDSVEVKDVLVGEVWFASGQSNMECPIWGSNTRYRDGNGALVAAMTRLPYVRFAKNDRVWTVTPERAKSRGWKRLEPESFAGGSLALSAVAFYYARELYLALDIPIGIVESSWGGTNIDAWTPRSGYADCDASIRFAADYPVKANWKRESDARGAITGAVQQPTVLYNGMVSSWAPMAMRGFIWYQGCHNDCENQFYYAKLKALYAGWTREFGNPGLKFYLVQLAPWKKSWIGICEAQNRFVAEQPNAAIAVTADVGNFDDIHPNDKEIVAKRLAVHALKRDYGFEIAEDCSPVFRSVRFEGDRAVVDFDHAKDWYVYSPDRSRETAFEVAGTNGVWRPAAIVNFRRTKNAKGETVDTDFIDGSSIEVRAADVPAPAKVRYAVRPRTAGTLYNQAALPLGQFTSEGK